MSMEKIPEFQPAVVQTELASERVILESPMSFTGSALRIWRLTDISAPNQWARAGLVTGAILLVTIAWAGILFWYSCALIVWPLLLIFRVLGRSRRKEEAEQLRHREMLEAMERSGR